jgi:tRNA (guanine37-N1)-methyltransferase
MRIDVITLFDEMCEAVLSESIIGRARAKGAIDIRCHQLRDFAFDRHKRVDDTTYGGGMGMLMMAEPIALCFESITEEIGTKPHFIYMSPKGQVLTQKKLKELSGYENICILCGHYEGVDQRVLDMYVDEEISIGDYVLTGGELPALVLADSLSRLQKGVLSEDECFELESHYDGLLEYPQYTKPAEWRGVGIPEVLLSGHHANIVKWRREQSIIETAKKRPDMIPAAPLSEKERALADETIREAALGDSVQNSEADD